MEVLPKPVPLPAGALPAGLRPLAFRSLGLPLPTHVSWSWLLTDTNTGTRMHFPSSLLRDGLKSLGVPKSSRFEGVLQGGGSLFWLLPKEKDHRTDSKLDGTYKGNKNWVSTHTL